MHTKDTEGMPVRSAGHMKPQRVTNDKLEWGTIQYVYIDRDKRSLIKMSSISIRWKRPGLRIIHVQERWGGQHHSCPKGGTKTASVATEVPTCPLSPRPTGPQLQFWLGLREPLLEGDPANRQGSESVCGKRCWGPEPNPHLLPPYDGGWEI